MYVLILCNMKTENMYLIIADHSYIGVCYQLRSTIH
jgi:hypothetical protein